MISRSTSTSTFMHAWFQSAAAVDVRKNFTKILTTIDRYIVHDWTVDMALYRGRFEYQYMHGIDLK